MLTYSFVKCPNNQSPQNLDAVATFYRRRLGHLSLQLSF
jgi:hypothetical protein